MEYYPSIKNTVTGEYYDFRNHAMTYHFNRRGLDLCKATDKEHKGFTSWDPSKYMSGKAEDYIAVRKDDYNDVYIIEKSIFHMTYQKYE